MISRRMTSRRAAVLITVGLMLLINVPAVLGIWSQWRLDKVGVSTQAAVTGTPALPEKKPERFFVRYRLPADADRGRPQYIAPVDRDTWEAAQAEPSIGVTYLPGNAGVNRVEGQVESSLGLWITAIADLALVGLLLLAMKFRPAREKPLVLLATADVVRARPGFSVEQDGIEHVVRGEVLRMTDGEIVLQVGPEREVRVILGEHRNPVGYQQPAEVRGRRIEP